MVPAQNPLANWLAGQVLHAVQRTPSEGSESKNPRTQGPQMRPLGSSSAGGGLSVHEEEWISQGLLMQASTWVQVSPFPV